LEPGTFTNSNQNRYRWKEPALGRSSEVKITSSDWRDKECMHNFDGEMFLESKHLEEKVYKDGPDS
jgi:hypothetical protein